MEVARSLDELHGARPALTQLSEDERMMFEETLRFARQDVAPYVAEMDETESVRPEILAGLHDMGLMGIEIPARYGGAESSFFVSVLAVEALAIVDPAVAVIADVQNTLVNNVFLRWGSDLQKEKYLSRLASRDIGAYCLTEAESGSDAFALRARAYEEGDFFRLEGKKLFITNAKEASLFVIFANINPEAGYKGITAFVVDRNFEGFRIGKKERKLGIRASSTCEVILDGVRVPRTNVIGEVGKGYRIAIETLNEGRIGIAAQMVGLAEGALEGAKKYVGERMQFGRFLREFQAIQFQIASMATEIEAARLLTYNAARLRDAGQSFVKEAAMAKYFASEVAERVSSLALECYGGYGFIKEFPAEKFYRDAKIGKLYEGTSNMQMQTIFKLVDQGTTLS